MPSVREHSPHGVNAVLEHADCDQHDQKEAEYLAEKSRLAEGLYVEEDRTGQKGKRNDKDVSRLEDEGKQRQRNTQDPAQEHKEEFQHRGDHDEHDEQQDRKEAAVRKQPADRTRDEVLHRELKEPVRNAVEGEMLHNAEDRDDEVKDADARRDQGQPARPGINARKVGAMEGEAMAAAATARAFAPTVEDPHPGHDHEGE